MQTYYTVYAGIVQRKKVDAVFIKLYFRAGFFLLKCNIRSNLYKIKRSEHRTQNTNIMQSVNKMLIVNKRTENC